MRPGEVGIIEASIAAVEFLGADTMLTCKVGEELITVRASGRSSFSPGAPITLSFASEDLALFDRASGARLVTSQALAEALQP